MSVSTEEDLHAIEEVQVLFEELQHEMGQERFGLLCQRLERDDDLGWGRTVREAVDSYKSAVLAAAAMLGAS